MERFKHPSAQAVVNEIRDFVNEFPANLTRLQAARRIHHFLGQVTPKLLQVGGEMEMEIRSVDIICFFLNLFVYVASGGARAFEHIFVLESQNRIAFF